MSGLGLLATAFGSYASTLGGLYKEQVEKEQAAQGKLAAEERDFKRQLALKDIDHEWERQKTAEERRFTIDLLQREFEQGVALANYKHKLKLEEKERGFEYEQRRKDYAAQVKRRDDMIRSSILGQGAGKGGGDNMDPRIFTAQARALADRVRSIAEMANNARREERERWLNQYNAALQDLVYFLKYGEIPNDSGNVGGTPSINPEDIVNWLADE
jgi:AraC-like DNA-binding protein